MILGIDEVGRGPWAGPLVIGACVLNDDPREDWQDLLTDSKKLTPKKREELEPLILNGAAAYGLGWVSAGEIDEVGLSAALRLACRRAVEEVRKKSVPFHEIIIDGTINFLSDTSLENYVSTLKKADLLIKEVSAASIIAKVARDRYMVEIAEKYPEYGFDRHVGYGTKLHRAMLTKYGPCSEHRTSFKPVKKEKTIAKKHGDAGENVAVTYLINNGHRILARNYRTRRYEIDIISRKDDIIYFTEVKYRKDDQHGSPLEMIGHEKLRQMKFAANAFMYQKKLPYQPKLAVASVIGPDYQLDKWFPLEAE